LYFRVGAGQYAHDITGPGPALGVPGGNPGHFFKKKHTTPLKVL
jgi:hypothetical protein